MNKESKPKGNTKFPVIVNLLIIAIVAFLGLWIVYYAIAIFTHHGEEQVVPKVENMSYTKAVELLHSYGLNVEIRDSLYREDVKPGFVLEQFPKANSVVKPGRKIFLYINAVHPKEVIIDDHNDRTQLALKGWSFRQGLTRLQELGFKDIEVMVVLGDNDRILKILANGKPVHQMQKVPIDSKIIIEVNDGRLGHVRDSLFELENLGFIIIDNVEEEEPVRQSTAPSGSSNRGSSAPSAPSTPSTEYFDMPTEEPSTGGNAGGGGQSEPESNEFF